MRLKQNVLPSSPGKLLLPGLHRTSLQLFVFPLVQLLSQPRLPAVWSHDLHLTNQKAASELLRLVEQQQTVTMTTWELPQPSLSSPRYSLLVSTGITYHCLITPHPSHPTHSTPSQPTPSTPSQWLCHLLDTFKLSPSSSLPPNSLDHIVIVLTALAFGQTKKLGGEKEEEEEEKLIGNLLQAFAAVAKADPAMVRFL